MYRVWTGHRARRSFWSSWKTADACFKPSREVAQMLASTISKWGLNREVQAALLRVRTKPECPESNLRELM